MIKNTKSFYQLKLNNFKAKILFKLKVEDFSIFVEQEMGKSMDGEQLNMANMATQVKTL
jgi:hypothetical protein